MGFLHITPVEPKAATGADAAVYRQQRADVGLARMPALIALSPAPGLLAAGWAMLRESLMAGPVSRTDREIVALGVSKANECAYCVGAHTMFLHAIGEHDLAESLASGGRPRDARRAALYAWALGETRDAPDAPELLGTALTFHFINRMISILHTPDVLPGGLQNTRVGRSVGGRALSKPARRLLDPGASLPLLLGGGSGEGSAQAAGSPSGPSWAAGSPVGPAYTALTEAAGRGAGLLPDPERVTAAVARWDGRQPPLGGSWPADALTGLDPDAVPPTRLALLAALAPYRITKADVAAWPHTDESLVRLLAFGAITAVRHAERAFSTAAAA
ncbi:carboxymuconolactone decarboxylase family protein [Nonomuraea typhae]|uniref:carboxymuconolactone decarboxylase family protein n=1 Tax=Nonomuraea typhae TaxID=2603600 RepID=UPI0012F817C2|nr:carboxymuconolactone decarboxylase family protein [Nonomuraea typhae]